MADSATTPEPSPRAEVELDRTIAADEDSKDVVDPQPDPARVGRFVVLDRIGSGGMGVVYAAYDQQLDRKLALKLLHGDGQDKEARTRIMREAQAMAKLSHPNVVQVYEAGTHDGQIFLAMELVRGQTLSQWRDARPRSTSEVIDVFLQAGRGLATAHAAGLVHRDFKPENVLVGDDGRVRVVDFGLARPHGRRERKRHTGVPGELRPTDTLSTEVTRDGQLIGTPAYMAPEQYTGGQADARSDQFAFCVALFETAFGERPFRGDTLPELSAAVIGGQLATTAEQTKRVEWLRRVLLRGLSVEPDDRFDSMSELLQALSPPRSRFRTSQFLAAGFGVLAALGGYAVWNSQPGLAACDPPLAAASWDEQSKERLREAFVSADAEAGPARYDRVAGLVDDYTAAWSEREHDVCESAGVQDGAGIEAVVSERECLRDRSRELASLLVAVERGDTDAHLGAHRAVLALHPISRCMTEAQRAALAPTADDLDGAMAVKLQIARAYALNDVGDQQRAVQVAREARRAAEQVGDDPLRAHALFVVSYISYGAGYGPEGYALAEEAVLAAETAGDDFRGAVGLVWLAIASRFFGRLEDANSWKAKAEGAARSLGADPEVEAWLSFYEGKDDRTDLSTRVPSLQRSLELFTEVYGPDSQEAHGTATNLGNALIDVGRLDEAYAMMDKLRRLNEANLGPHASHVIWDYQGLARVRAIQGRLDEAISLIEQAVENVETGDADNHLLLALAFTSRGQFEARAGRFEQALVSLRTGLEHNIAATRNPAAEAGLRVELALTLLALDRSAEAADHLRAGEKTLSEVLSLRELREHNLYPELTKLSLWAALEQGDAEAAIALAKRPIAHRGWMYAYLQARAQPSVELVEAANAELAKAPADAETRDARYTALRNRANSWLAAQP